MRIKGIILFLVLYQAAPVLRSQETNCPSIGGFYGAKNEGSMEVYIDRTRVETSSIDELGFVDILQDGCEITVVSVYPELSLRIPSYRGTLNGNDIFLQNIEEEEFNSVFEGFTVTVNENNLTLSGRYDPITETFETSGGGNVTGTITNNLNQTRRFTLRFTISAIAQRDRIALSWDRNILQLFEGMWGRLRLEIVRSNDLFARNVNLTTKIHWMSADRSDIIEITPRDVFDLSGEKMEYLYDRENVLGFNFGTLSDQEPEGRETLILSVSSLDPDVELPGDLIIEIYDSEDFDEDELSDLWELENFGNLDHNGSGDADNDGITNLIEQDYGTDPLNPGKHPWKVLVDIQGKARLDTAVPEYFIRPDLFAGVIPEPGNEVYYWTALNDEAELENFGAFSSFAYVPTPKPGQSNQQTMVWIHPKRSVVLDSNILNWKVYRYTTNIFDVDYEDYIEGGSSLTGTVPYPGWANLSAMLQGPGELSFWWKTDVGELRLYVGSWFMDEVAVTDSDEWIQEIVSIPKGLQRIVFSSSSLGQGMNTSNFFHLDSITTTADPQPYIDPSELNSVLNSDGSGFANVGLWEDPDMDGINTMTEILFRRDPYEYEPGVLRNYSVKLDRVQKKWRITGRFERYPFENLLGPNRRFQVL